MNSSTAFKQIAIVAFLGLLVGVVESVPAEESTGPSESEAVQKPTPADSVEKLARFTWTVLDAIEREHIHPPERDRLLRSVALLLTVPDKSKRPNLTADGTVVVGSGRYLPSGVPEVTRVKLPDQEPVFRRLRSCQNIDHFAEVFQTIWREFQNDAPVSEDQYRELLIYLRAKMDFLDIVPTKQEVIDEQVRANRYIGIGVLLGPDSGQRILFNFIRPGGPADRAGLKAGTTVLEIGGESTREMPSAAAIDRIRGPVGTEVVLEVLDPGSKEAREIRIKRGFVRIDSLGEQNMSSPRPTLERVESMAIGRIKFNDISSSTVSELRNADASARSQGLRVMILDFRSRPRSDNLEQARLVADSLMDGGTIWSEVTRHGDVRQVADRECLFRDMPLVILVSSDNPNSILIAIAAALQDAGRATIVGGRVDYNGRVSTAMTLPGFPYTLHLNTLQLTRARQDARWPLVPDQLVARSQTANRQQVATRLRSVPESSEERVDRARSAESLRRAREFDEPASAVAPANVKSSRGLDELPSFQQKMVAQIQKRIKEAEEVNRLNWGSLQEPPESEDQTAIRFASEILKSLPPDAP